MATVAPWVRPYPNQDMGEVEINENPESVSIEAPDSGVLIDFDPSVSEMMGLSHDANLAS